jgi:hypothetical protein
VVNVFLNRETKEDKQTLGLITIPDPDDEQNILFQCLTLELPWLNNSNEISCIPIGIYKVVWTYSNKFKKYTYEVLGVLNRAGIRIHSANTYKQIEGCIVLGTDYRDIDNDQVVDILNSRNTVKEFEDILERKSFWLSIQ